MRRKLLFATLGAIGLFGGSAHAKIVDFKYTATGGYFFTSGSGSFTTSGSDGTFTLGSGLTNFSLSGVEGVDIYALFEGGYSGAIGDLSNFSATLSGGALTGLSFTTVSIPVSLYYGGSFVSNDDLSFSASGLSSGNLTIAEYYRSLSGTLVAAAVPEPSTWAMMLLGFAGLGFAGYRQTKRRGDVAFSAA